MVGAYVGWEWLSQGLDWFPAFWVAMLACALLGVLIERVAYRPLRNASRLAALTSAIGASLFLEYGMMAVFHQGRGHTLCSCLIKSIIFTVSGLPQRIFSF